MHKFCACFGTKNICKDSNKFSDPKIFQNRICFDPKLFSHQSFFCDPKCLQTHNLFGLKIFSDPKFLWDQTFLSDLIFHLAQNLEI